jgi:CheY-like chemotaxis protein
VAHGAHAETVLVVDDNADVRDNVGECLEGEGFVCWLAPSCDAALERLEHEAIHPAIVLLDLHLPGMPAVEFVQRLERAWADVRLVLMTGDADIPTWLQRHSEAVLFKPFGVPQLIAAVRHSALTRCGVASHG